MNSSMMKQDCKQDIFLSRGVTNIGRAKDNEIVLPLRAVSAYHAKIVTFSKIAYIQDLGSTNGTYVNGKLTHYHVLQPGDYVYIGGCYIYIIGLKDAPESQTAVNTNHHMISQVDPTQLISLG